MRCLVWFREDLRIQDNTALYHAARLAGTGLIAVYIIAVDDWRRHNIAACRVDFILRQLKSLSAALDKLNIPLLVYQVDDTKAVIDTLQSIITQQQIDALFFNYQYEIDEARRDLRLESTLSQEGTQVFAYHDQTIIPPGEILTASANYYTVFTPFKKTWLKRFEANPEVHVYPAISKQAKLNIVASEIPSSITDYHSTISPDLWPAGEAHAQQRLVEFTTQSLSHYARLRDFPAAGATSQLSPYLAAGIISARQCLKAALAANHHQLKTGKLGAVTWINELIWREFYKHILYAFPRVSMNRAFKLNTEDIPWDNNETLFAAWCAGRTGYPIVDAAMRQLQQTGWMHNRLRMVSAMFLVKDLLIDWRWGERFFMQHLIDGDLAANNGGWQWAASTGTDAVPYFRVFNPTSQGQRFDPEGQFIKHYCPELSHLTAKDIHEPHKLGPSRRASLGYPQPIVDHSQARQKVLQIFKNLSSNKV